MSQPKFRSTVAAALLLVPLAGTLAASGAQAATPAAAAQPAIANLSLDSDAGLSPGATLRVRLEAARNARSASVALGDSGVTVPLHQQKAGHYTGTYVVRHGDRIDPMQLLTADVTLGERTYTRQFNFPPGFQALAMGARQEPQRSEREDAPARRRDVHAPHITQLTPDNGEQVDARGSTEVSARLSDEGSGIDPDSVRLRLNGRDVGPDLRVADGEAVYRGHLDPGRYRAELTVRDRAGNTTIKSWGFDVASRGERYGGGSGAFPLTVTSFADHAVVDASGELPIRGRTAPYANVRVQVESVADAAGLIGLTRPVADQTVQADGQGRFGVIVAPRGVPAPGTRYDIRVTATSGSQTAEERLSLTQREG